MSCEGYKNFCQWSGIGDKRTLDQTMAKNLMLKLKTTAGNVSGRRSTWPVSIRGPADCRGRNRRGAEPCVSNPTLEENLTDSVKDIEKRTGG